MGRMEGKLLRAGRSDDRDRGQALRARGRVWECAEADRPGRVPDEATQEECSFACGVEGKTSPFVSKAILSSRALAVATLEKSDFVTGCRKTQGPSLQTCFLGCHHLLWRNRGQSV